MMARLTWKTTEEHYAQPWQGPKRRYDLAKEFVVALSVMTLLTVVLAAVFGSPDEKAVTLQQWATDAPNDFVVTAVSELAGTSGSATYGAPYVNDPEAGQKMGPIELQRWAGVRQPIDPANDFVLTPLSTFTGDQSVSAALDQYRKASDEQRAAWATAYADALDKATDNDPAAVEPGDYGPVPALAKGLLAMASSGALEGQLAQAGSFYQTNYARSLLFLADGTYFEDQAVAQHLGGDQWGMMNETGRYPGQAWLWLYSFWYQIPPFSTSDNADAWIWVIMMALSVVLVLVPFIPGLRALPRHLGIHRIIWREHYRTRR